MRIYVFKSETRKDLRAFAADLAGSILRFALHGWCICVLNFEPIGGTPGTVDGLLRFDTILSRAIALEMLVEPYAGVGPWSR